MLAGLKVSSESDEWTNRRPREAKLLVRLWELSPVVPPVGLSVKTLPVGGHPARYDVMNTDFLPVGTKTVSWQNNLMAPCWWEHWTLIQERSRPSEPLQQSERFPFVLVVESVEGHVTSGGS